MGWLAFDPPNAPGSRFAGRDLLVRYGPLEGDVSFHAAQIREEGSGMPRRVRVNYEVYRFRTRPGAVTCSLAGWIGYGKIAVCVPSPALLDHDPGRRLASVARPQRGVQGRGNHGAPS
jgi:hypothetical protein